MEEIEYGLYDSRYHTEPSRAVCFSVCPTLKKARKERHDYGTDVVIVKLTVKNNVIIKREIVT